MENTMTEPEPDSRETLALLDRVDGGDEAARERLLERHRAGLHSFVELRLDPRLRKRLDPSDVVQDVQMEAVRRLPDYLRRRPMPFRLWLRKAAHERLLMLRRRHLGARRRSVGREVQLPDQSSLVLAEQLLSPDLSPDEHLDRAEQIARVREALGRLTEADREILLMRYYERLTYEDAACILGIEPAAARKRHGRALLRLHKVLDELNRKDG
jgi:RNA polymerase sigma-70 factor (ECF subfamily)